MEPAPRSTSLLLGLVFSFATVAGFAAGPAQPAHTPGAPLCVTLNGDDILSPDSDRVDERLQLLRSMGVTSIQSYVYWSRVETSPGVLDWSYYDRQVKKFQEHGLKWVPFVVFGPWYLTPEFVRQDPEITMYRCLEHGRDSKIPSLWSPRLREYIRTYLQRFADHYRPMSVLESVNIGITGDYGEAIYSVIGNWPGSYHSHNGYWCGDPLAEADFRRHAQILYPAGIAALNQAWKSNYASFADVKPFSPTKAPSERAWQEFLAWYRGSMTSFAEYCVATSRKSFPQEDIYLCTGGDMSPEHGSDFFEQARIAAKYRAGIRITNEASSFAANVRYTRMVATACRHYGAYFGHEPAALVTPTGMLGRIFNSVTSGASQLFFYYGAEIIDSSGGTPVPGPSGLHLQRYRPVMNITKPVIDTAVYHPNPSSQQVLSAEVSRQALLNFSEMLHEVRRFIDYDLLDDSLIAEGALKQKKILIVPQAEVMDARTTARIEEWVKQGGILYSLASRPVDWEGSTAGYDALVGLTRDTDVLDAISNDGIVIPRKDVLPSIAALKGVYFTRAYTNQAPDAEILLAMAYAPKAGVAWRRPLGQGMVYTYFGPMDMRQQEGSWIESHRLPLRFIRDTLQVAITEKRLAEIPPTLNLESTDVFKVMTDRGLWLLNMADQPRTVTVGGQPTTLPATSITAP